MRSVSAVVIAVVLAMLVAACGGGGSSSSSSSPSGQEVVADGGHQPGYVYKSATGKGGPQETAEVQAYVQETLGPGWEGECVSFEAPGNHRRISAE